jgi:hypothetical protein
MKYVPATLFGILAAALIVVTASTGYAKAPAYETKTPQIRIALSQSSVQAGDTFEAAFWLQGYLGEYGGIEGFEFQAIYDPSLIQPIFEAESDTFRSAIFPEDAEPITWINSIDRSGTIKFAQSLSSQNASGHFSGNGKIGTISFKAVKEGSASLTLKHTIMIKSGNPGVNSMHSFNRPSVAIGAVKRDADQLTTVGSKPEYAANERSMEDIIHSFADGTEIAKVSWARDAIAALTEYGAVKGMPNGEFNPNRQMTRGEFVQLAIVALGLDMQQQSIPTFGDIRSADWFYDAVETATAHGIIVGYDMVDGVKEFRPQNGITRAEIASVFSKYVTHRKKLPSQAISPEPVFGDVPAIHWAQRDIGILYHLGIVNGTTDYQFEPDVPTTRAQVCVMLHRLLQLE